MTPSQFNARTSRRIILGCPVVFGGVPFVGEGSLKNLSSTGCSVACDRSVLAGSDVRLAVLLPDSHAPLRVDLGKIRWVQDHTFGVEFIRQPVLAQRQLDHGVWAELARRLASGVPPASRAAAPAGGKSE